MAPNTPTVFILHGAWHTTAHYARLKSHLESLGFPVLLPAHPTCNNASPPNTTLQDDIANVRKVMEKLIAEKKQVIMLMHSYGGIVGTGALSGLCNLPSDHGSIGVIAMVYMCAFVPFENESLAGIFGGTLPPWLTPDPASGFLLVSDPQHHFYSDLSPSEQKQWAEQLVSHPIAAQVAPVQDAAWRQMSKRTWYIICDGDQALPPFLQEMMVERLQKEGIVVNVEHCSFGHSPFLNMPEKIGEVMEKVVNVAKAATTN